MNNKLLEIKALSIQYKNQKQQALHSMHLSVHQGESIGIVGESGSGKSSIAHAIMGLLHDKAVVKGTFYYEGKLYDWSTPKQWTDIRWKKIAIAFQNAENVLNPMMKVYKQVAEPMIRHLGYSKERAKQEASQLLEEVGLDESWWDAYPSQLSGGMRQKVIIAMALACSPQLLIIDEPTMSLDPEAKYQVVHMIKRLQKQHHFGLIVISHEMNIIKDLCSKLYVLYNGHHLEYGPIKAVLKFPKHPYTKGLITASWEMDAYRDIWGIPNSLRPWVKEACPFYSRCFQARDVCTAFKPQALTLERGHVVACCRGGIADLLRVEGVTKQYTLDHRLVRAVSDVSFTVKEGEVLSVLGASGSGKSTLASLIAGFEKKDGGIIKFMDKEIVPLEILRQEEGIQLVVQDPSSAMNGQWSVFDVLNEPFKWNLKTSKAIRLKKIHQLLQRMHLPDDEDFLNKLTKELSGGEKQRLAIARALLMSPKLLIADEVTAMLDPSNAANLIKMLKGMQNQFGFSMIYITHDLYLARKISDRTLVLDYGKMVAYGEGHQIIDEKIKHISDQEDLYKKEVRLI